MRAFTVTLFIYSTSKWKFSDRLCGITLMITRVLHKYACVKESFRKSLSHHLWVLKTEDFFFLVKRYGSRFVSGSTSTNGLGSSPSLLHWTQAHAHRASTQ